MSNAARALFTEQVLPLFEALRKPWIDQAREVARQIARRDGTVTIDQVRAVLPPPKDVDPRCMGAVLHSKEFTRVGFCNSERKECRGRPISIFALRDAT